MMKLLTMLLAAVFALSVAGTTWAADEAKKKEGEGKKPAAKKVTPEERFKKMDKDGDVDAEDFARFYQCFSGPDVAADPSCERQ